MSFFPAPITIPIRAKLENDRIVFADESKVVVKYLAVDDLINEGHGCHADRTSGTQASSAYPPRTFEVVEVSRYDARAHRRRGERLPKSLWSVTDVGSLESKIPEQRLTERAEKRVVRLSFDGRTLRRVLDTCDPVSADLQEALLEQAELRLTVLVDGKLLATLLVRPLISLQ